MSFEPLSRMRRFGRALRTAWRSSADPVAEAAHEPLDWPAELLNARALFEHMSEEVHLWKLVRAAAGEMRTWRLIDCNAATLRGWRKRREDVVGRTVEEIFPGATEHMAPIVRRIFAEQAPLRWRGYFPPTGQHLQMTSVPLGDFFLTTGTDISPTRRAELAVQESESRLQFIAASARIGYWHWDLPRDCLEWSDLCCELFGIPAGVPISYERFLAAVHPEDRARVDLAVRACLEGRREYDEDFRTLWPDGSVHWVRSKGSATFVDGKAQRMAGIVVDITERKLTDAELLSSKAQLQMVSDTLPAAVSYLEFDGSYRYRWVNHTVVEWFGVPREAIIGRTIEEVLGAQAWSEVQSRVERAFGGETVEFEQELAYQYGGARWVRAVYSPHRDERGVVQGVVALISDLSSERLAEQRLRMSEERFRLAAAATNDALWDFDLQAGRLWWNESYERLFGARPADSAGSIDWWAARVHPDDRERVLGTFRRALAGPAREWSAEYRIRNARGEWSYILDRAHIARDAGGRAVRSLGAMLDLTARKQMEDALRQRTAELETVLETTPAAIWVARDRACLTMTGNRAAHTLLRVAPGTNLSKSAPDADRSLAFKVFDAAGREIDAQDLPVQKAARTGTTQQGVRIELSFGDGTRRVLFGNAEPLRNGHGEVYGAVAALLDISELEAARRELERQNQSKDEFLATLAHELRNPLAPVRYAAAMLQANVPAATLDRAREMIERQVGHLARLIDDLLDVARITRKTIALQLCPVDMTRSVREALELARPAIQGRLHQVRLAMPLAPLWVRADAERLVQIVGNLLRNAIRYTEAGGTITVSVEQSDEWAVLRVQDTGIGFPPDAAAELFEMFTQLHRGSPMAHGGLGIGLAVVRQLVRLHGGEVSACSPGPGRGATFTVRLPLAVPDTADAPAAAGAVVRLFRQNMNVLLVEDNVDSAEALAILLRSRGLSVQVAHEGRAALSLAEALHPQVVILDIGLPDISGYEVARELRSRDWAGALRIVAVTGWAAEADRGRSQQAGIDLHLAKPPDPNRLLQFIEEAGAAEAPRSARPDA